MRLFSWFRVLMWAAIFFGILFRFLTFFSYDFEHGVIIYTTMAESLVRDGSFTMPFGTVMDESTSPGPSHHFPPLYPLYLSIWLYFFSYSPIVLHCASIASSFMFLALLYLVFRDLYDEKRAVVMTSFFAMNGILIDVTGKCLSENVLLSTMVLTYWAAFRAIRIRGQRQTPLFWSLTGLFAGIGFLGKAQAGPAWGGLLIVSLVGYRWLKKRIVVKAGAYFGGILIFGIISGGWLLRNYLLFGESATSLHNSRAYLFAVNHTDLWFHGLIGITPVFAAVTGFFLIPLFPLVRRISCDEPEKLVLLITGFLLILSSWLITGAVWTWEGGFYDLNSTRYIVTFLLPLTWLVISSVTLNNRWEKRWLTLALGIWFVSSLSILVWSFASPEKGHVASKDIWAAEQICELATDGDCVRIQPETNKNQLLYYYLRCAESRGITLYNGVGGEDCQYLVNYGVIESPDPERYQSIRSWRDDRVRIYRRIP